MHDDLKRSTVCAFKHLSILLTCVYKKLNKNTFHFNGRPDGRTDQILRSHTELCTHNLKTFSRYGRGGASRSARRLSKSEFGPYIFTPPFFKRVFSAVSRFSGSADFGARIFFLLRFFWYWTCIQIFFPLFFGVDCIFSAFRGRLHFYCFVSFLHFAKSSSTRVANSHPLPGTRVPPVVVKSVCNCFRRGFFWDFANAQVAWAY